jgi:hypothetical protein
MQTDFHFYAIYAICRMAGYSARDANTVAYASQYTDDAESEKPIHFNNGGSFLPMLTAHKALSLANFTLNVQKRVYLAFHFMPSAEKPKDRAVARDPLLTQPACRVAGEVLAQALARKNEPDFLHALGIALHSFADTWSHQNFSGLMGPENDNELLYLRGRGRVSRFLRRLWHHVMEFLMPAIGHGELLNLPDTPYLTFSYYNYYHARELKGIHNPTRFLDAARCIFERLGGTAWERYEPHFRTLFHYQGTLEQRCKRWEEALRENIFGFALDPADKTLRYDPNEWFQAALRETAPGSERYLPCRGFQDSDYVRFHAAARNQQKRVLAALDQNGVIVSQALLKTLLVKFTAFAGKLFSLQGRKSFTWKAAKRAAFRFFIYGAMMISGEVAFYTVVKLGRSVPLDFLNRLFKFEWLVDPRLNLGAIWEAPIKVLYGQASLWMFFVYAAIGLFGIEPVYKRIRRQHWLLRGLTYMFIILFMECACGWALRGLLGYDIWYYRDRYDILKYTSWAIAPMWFVVGLLSENFVNFVLKYNEKKDQLRVLRIIKES